MRTALSTSTKAGFAMAAFVVVSCSKTVPGTDTSLSTQVIQKKPVASSSAPSVPQVDFGKLSNEELERRIMEIVDELAEGREAELAQFKPERRYYARVDPASARSQRKAAM